jgi:hypothetical protein
MREQDINANVKISKRWKLAFENIDRREKRNHSNSAVYGAYMEKAKGGKVTTRNPSHSISQNPPVSIGLQ